MVGGIYEAERRIAAGGIGEVWAATHRKNRRQVAIKRLLPEAAAHREVVVRFEQEGQLLGRIFSDFVVRRVDFLTDPAFGRVLVEDFIEGELLSSLLAVRVLGVEETRELGFNLLRALVGLERARVVHCDLKPANIILKPLAGGRRPMLIDFGAARLLASSSGSEQPSDERGIGTFEYMAPEQFVCAAKIGPATDLYAVGAILYRAITGRSPFSPDLEGTELVRAKLSRPALPLDTGRSDWMAQKLEAVVARALKAEPAARYSCADDMLTDLMALPRDRAA
jgi:serine/threonine-protein kinase